MSKIIAGRMLVGDGDDELHFRDDDAQKKLEGLIVQEKGNNKTVAMSQAAATVEFDKLSEDIDALGRVIVSPTEPTDEEVDLWIDTDDDEEIPVVTADDIAQELGDDEQKVLSQAAAKKAVTQERNRAVAREDEIEGLFTMPTQEAVDKWLDEHPEATTTVQNGSLTAEKFTNDLKLHTIKDYVTPEMFGAKGDGVTDDTEAMQSAIDNGRIVVLTSFYKVKNVKLKSHIIIIGTGYNSGVVVSENEAAFVYDKTVERMVFERFSIKGYGIGFDYVNKEAYFYLADSIFSFINFYASLSVGIRANLILCTIDNCIFGYYGTANPNGASHVIVEGSAYKNSPTHNLFRHTRFYFATERSCLFNTSLNTIFEHCNFERNDCSEYTVEIIGGLKVDFYECWIELNAGNSFIRTAYGDVYPQNINTFDKCYIMNHDTNTAFGVFGNAKMCLTNSIIYCQSKPIVSNKNQISAFYNNQLFNKGEDYEEVLPVTPKSLVSGGYIKNNWFDGFASGNTLGWKATNIGVESGSSKYFGNGVRYECDPNGYNIFYKSLPVELFLGKTVKLVCFANRESTDGNDALRLSYSFTGATYADFIKTNMIYTTKDTILETEITIPEDAAVFNVGFVCGGTNSTGEIFACDVISPDTTLYKTVLSVH